MLDKKVNIYEIRN